MKLGYTQLPFKFILENSEKISPFNLSLSTFDYTYLIKKFTTILSPYPEPNLLLEDYLILKEKWRVKCFKNVEYRELLRNELIRELKEIVAMLEATRLKPKPTSYFVQNVNEYKFYHKELVDCWIELWRNVDVAFETLETLLLFKKLLNRNCLNEKSIQADHNDRNEMWRESAREAKEEERYWNNNYYEEGGGGQDWSDPF